MKRLLITTALMTVLAAPLAAQQDRMDTPEGYTPFEDISRLTLDDLQGATVYDVNGETLGEISDIVFSTTGADGQMSGDGAQDMTDDTLQDDDLPDANNVNEDGDDAALAGDQTGVDQGVEVDDAMIDGQDLETSDQTTDPADTDDLSLDVDPDAEGTAGEIAETAEEAAEEITDTATEAIEDINEEVENATVDDLDANADGTVDEMDATDDQTAGEMAEGELIPVEGAELSHVVIDIGGFLGIGGHTVAIPMEALQIFVDDGDNMQIYLPWTEEQLRDLPAYEEGNPETLGRMAD